MNNAKMWLVVKPTVGVPLFLTAVAVGSFAVHVAVLRNTTWVGNFLQGKAMNTAAAVLPETNAAVKFDSAGEAKVVLPDGRTAKLILVPQTDSTKTAMADPKLQVPQ
jgi:light-harvesting protein B-800-850 alpha chain